MCAFVRFLKIFDVRIFVRFLAKICAHLSLELLDTLSKHKVNISTTMKQLLQMSKKKSKELL